MEDPQYTATQCRRGLEILAERSQPIRESVATLEEISKLVAQLPEDLVSQRIFLGSKNARVQLSAIVAHALAGQRERIAEFDQTHRNCAALLARADALVRVNGVEAKKAVGVVTVTAVQS